MHIAQDYETSAPPGRVSRAEIIGGLERLGLAPGDRVVAHTSLSSFGHVDGGAATVIEALLTVLGPSGTLMMPHFLRPYFDGAYDARCPAPSYNGVVPNLLRTWPGAITSLHPSHPVVALGPEATRMTEGHFRVSSVGRDSPMDRMAKAGAKVLLLGVNQVANSTIHIGEAYARPPYWGRPRPDRAPGRWMIFPDGHQEWIVLPETPGDSAGFGNIEPWLVERGLIAFERIGRARCRLMPGQPLIETVVDFLAMDPGGLLCYLPECSFCPWARQFVPRQSRAEEALPHSQ
jgi:aminoglycoside 3-N-acetyltransferase